MAKLFPPIIEGVIPAFYSENGTAVKITVPFSLNRAVSKAQVKAISLKMKTVQSSSYLYSEISTDMDLESDPSVSFIIEDENNRLKIGQFYKIQIAFINEKDEVGYYSSVGVAKYTTLPILKINDYKTGQINSHSGAYTGLYQQTGDATEKVSSYRFDVYDNLNNIIYTSGDQLHDSSADTDISETYDVYNLNVDFLSDVIYRVQYSVTTTNGLTISTPKYKVAQRSSLNADLNVTILVENDTDNGMINISMIGEKDAIATGAFLLSRSSSDSNFTSWDALYRFSLMGQSPTRQLFQDFTIEQGKTYQYSLQQYNSNGLYSNRILSKTIYSDFEDAFLYDGEKQLRIRYNPKVTSFKVNTLETKTDTIGGVHPFIFRNGRTYYKEFPISGLISYKIDEDEMFLHREEYDFEEDTIDLTSKNITQERKFKMSVYEWLTNGKPKLFRSPGEGNYIVRLLNVSLTPNDTVGRMLHTFSSTAYEVADMTYNNLTNYGIIEASDASVSYMRWKTVGIRSLAGTKDNVLTQDLQLNDIPAQTLRFTDMVPGDKIKITYGKGESSTIVIGVTGSYFIDIDVPIKTITLLAGSSVNGSMTYSYYTVQKNNFNKVSNVTIEEVPARQFIGEHNIIQEITGVQDDKGNWVNNPKIEIVKFMYLNAQRRTRENITQDENGVYYKDSTYKLKLDKESADPFTLFQVGTWSKTDVFYTPSRPAPKFTINGYYDIYNDKLYDATGYNPTVKINNSIISVEETRDFETTRLDNIQSFEVGNGVTVNCGYQIRIIDYSIEETDLYSTGIITKKKAYKDAVAAYEAFDYDNFSQDKLEKVRAQIKEAYRQYILALIKAQELEKKAESGDL